MGYLPNLPGLWRVSCWTQGLGTYLLINLDLNGHTQIFWLKNPWFLGYLPNLPEFWRVFCWTQGLGTYLPINLDLNTHTPIFDLETHGSWYIYQIYQDFEEYPDRPRD